MNFFFIHHPVKKLKDETVKPTLVQIQSNEHNITEGGEFLDDAIRMKDQSLIDLETSIGAINSNDLYDYSAE